MNSQHSHISLAYILLHCIPFFFNCSFVVTSVTGEDHRKEFTIRCDVLPFHSIGMSTTKKEAKQIAATKMIKLVNSNDVASDSSSSSIQNADAVGALINLCRQCNFSLP